MVLPNFLRAKKRLMEQIDTAVRLGANQRSLIPHDTGIRVHEGDRLGLHRCDGSYDETPFKVFTFRGKLGRLDLERRGLSAVAEAVESLAQQAADSTHKELFSEVQRVTPETNRLDAKGKPLRAEMILEMYERLEMQFTPDGSPILPTLVTNPSLESALRRESARISSEPDLKRRFEKIIDVKRREARDRENSRKLVD